MHQLIFWDKNNLFLTSLRIFISQCENNTEYLKWNILWYIDWFQNPMKYSKFFNQFIRLLIKNIHIWHPIEIKFDNNSKDRWCSIQSFDLQFCWIRSRMTEIMFWFIVQCSASNNGFCFFFVRKMMAFVTKAWYIFCFRILLTFHQCQFCVLYYNLICNQKIIIITQRLLVYFLIELVQNDFICTSVELNRNKGKH